MHLLDEHLEREAPLLGDRRALVAGQRQLEDGVRAFERRRNFVEAAGVVRKARQEDDHRRRRRRRVARQARWERVRALRAGELESEQADEAAHDARLASAGGPLIARLASAGTLQLCLVYMWALRSPCAARSLIRRASLSPYKKDALLP